MASTKKRRCPFGYRPLPGRPAVSRVQRRMTSRAVRQLVTTFVLVLVCSGVAAAQSPAQNAADADRLVKALDLRPGAVVAEVGAGDGSLTVLVAKAVGDSGRVFTTEVNRDRLEQIASTVRQAGLTNVTVVTGGERDSNLPAGCCDAVFMRDVYHHFDDPAAINASLRKALKPGGRLAILDFGPPGAESADPAARDRDGQHGITPATLERELEAAGFEVLSTEAYGFRSSMTVARRPPAPCPQ